MWQSFKEDLSHNLQLFGSWLGVRMINVLAVVGAFAFTGTDQHSLYLAPLFALPVGLAYSTFITYHEHNRRERKITNAYRHEIASILGKDWREVKVEDMRHVAEGDPEKNLPPMPIFQQQLRRDALTRTIEFVSHVAAALVTIATAFFVLKQKNDEFNGVGEVFASWIEKLTGINNLGVRFPIMVVSGLTTMASEIGFNVAGKLVTGSDKPTVYEEIQNIKRDLDNGYELTPSRVLSLMVQINPALDRAVKQAEGKAYDRLSAPERHAIAQSFEKYYHIEQIVDDINQGRVKPNELAFFIVGKQSGIAPKKPVATKLEVNEALAAPVKSVPQEGIAFLREAIARERQAAETPTVQGLSATSHQGMLQQIVARLQTHASFQERLEPQGASVARTAKA